MSSGKAQYAAYHSNFDVEEGYDVPESAFQKRHHRTRQRPDAKPGLHGSHLFVRRVVKPRLLARSHSLPGEDEFFSFFSEEEPAPAGADAKSGAMELIEWPSLCPAKNGEVAVAVDEAGKPGSEILAGKKKRGWQSFGPFLSATAPPSDGKAQKWAAAKKSESINGDTLQKPERQQAQEKNNGEELPTIKYKVEDAEDDMLDTGIAEAASRLFPRLVHVHLEGKDNKISVGLMKMILEDAVAVASLGTEHDKKNEQVAEDTEAPEEGLPVLLDGFADARDLRGKGWLKGHKASTGFKAAEKIAEKATRRSEQSNESKGVTTSKQGELGRSWADHDKERSKQHGGMFKSRKWPASHAAD